MTTPIAPGQDGVEASVTCLPRRSLPRPGQAALRAALGEADYRRLEEHRDWTRPFTDPVLAAAADTVEDAVREVDHLAEELLRQIDHAHQILNTASRRLYRHGTLDVTGTLQLAGQAVDLLTARLVQQMRQLAPVLHTYTAALAAHHAS
jgi:hypothetical protein